MTRIGRSLVALALAAPILGACGDDGDGDGESTVRLLTHDSFVVSDDVLAAFTEETGIEVEVLPAGDAGSVVNQAILTKDRPAGRRAVRHRHDVPHPRPRRGTCSSRTSRRSSTPSPTSSRSTTSTG